MVKKQNKNTARRRKNQEKADCSAKASEIKYCSERLVPFGYRLRIVTFIELI
jgi:hypothetical protein